MRKLNTQGQDFEQLLQREGLPYSFRFTSYSAVDPAASTILMTQFPTVSTPAPFEVYVKSVYLYSNKNIVVRVQSDNGIGGPTAAFLGAAGISRFDTQVILTKNQTTRVELNYFPIYSGDIYVRFVESLDTTDTGTLKVGGSIEGVEITAGRDFTAPKVIMAVGDSITRGTGATNSATLQDHYTQRVKKWFMDNGTRCRLVNKGVSSLKQAGALAAASWGFYDIDACDLILYNVGVNDAGGTFGTTEQTAFRTSVDAWIDYKQGRYPNAKMIVFGPTPLQTAANEAKNVTVRSILQSAVTAAADSKIYYCSLANAFDPTNGANYVAGESPNGVHPVKQAEITTVITDFLTANNITL
jgi:lysophospholipase L1-like esterase